jgi:replicative superfamily II helicase
MVARQQVEHNIGTHFDARLSRDSQKWVQPLFRAKNVKILKATPCISGHAAPGIYARAFPKAG